MKPLLPSELWPLPVYETVRDEFRRTVIEAKKHRRITVGPFMTFVFENRLTVKFQTMEILRAEKVTDAAHLAEELDGFNTMLPPPAGLSATLLLELVGPEPEVKAELAKLVGLSQSVHLDVGGVRIPAKFDEGNDDGRRISAVQYVQFHLGAAAAAFGGAPVSLVVEHPQYTHRLTLSPEQRASLAEDLRPG
jgi:hypothetical protein